MTKIWYFCFYLEIEVDRLEQTESLEDVDLQENPLTMPNRNALQLVTRPRVVLSVTAADASEEDWDDLNV